MGRYPTSCNEQINHESLRALAANLMVSGLIVGFQRPVYVPYQRMAAPQPGVIFVNDLVGARTHVFALHDDVMWEFISSRPFKLQSRVVTCEWIRAQLDSWPAGSPYWAILRMYVDGVPLDPFDKD